MTTLADLQFVVVVTADGYLPELARELGIPEPLLEEAWNLAFDEFVTRIRTLLAVAAELGLPAEWIIQENPAWDNRPPVVAMASCEAGRKVLAFLRDWEE